MKETPLRIAGIDEVGRGPLAGPVVAAAVTLPREFHNAEIDDSKKLSPRKRETLSEIIRKQALEWSIVSLSPRVIDALNIREASRYAMAIALQFVTASEALVDGNVPIHCDIPHRTVVGGDALHIEIAAASIIAKVWRDELMAEFARVYPEYGFERNAGYPTKQHRDALAHIGISGLHRITFKGVKEFSHSLHPQFQDYPFEDIVVCRRDEEKTFPFLWHSGRVSGSAVSHESRIFHP
ncbi:MAG: ribonuclease HII [Bdellovibrionales bacterium]|nr:ribonuclease HII [Bdellovibrionales bacterium]